MAENSFGVSLVHLTQQSESCGPSKVKVSSVLNRDVKQFGKKFMFDDNEETCWNSDQGSLQWVSMELPHLATLSSIHVRFQGGFAARHCVLSVGVGSEQLELHSFYPEDNNSLQVFPVPSSSSQPASRNYKIEFRTSTDFYGRITVYHLQLYGQVS